MLHEVRIHRLAELRKQQGLTQTDVAQQMGVSQRRVSQIERGKVDRSEVSTLRVYVEAIGGRVEIVADAGQVLPWARGCDGSCEPPPHFRGAPALFCQRQNTGRTGPDDHYDPVS